MLKLTNNTRVYIYYIYIGEIELLEVEFSFWPLINRDWFQIIRDNLTVCRVPIEEYLTTI